MYLFCYRNCQRVGKVDIMVAMDMLKGTARDHISFVGHDEDHACLLEAQKLMLGVDFPVRSPEEVEWMHRRGLGKHLVFVTRNVGAALAYNDRTKSLCV